MGFFLRKALKVGPFRLNLSKSGIGISAGVKGARIGIRPDGSAYTHAGRYGLYHRQELGKVKGHDSTWTGKKKSLPAPEIEPIDYDLNIEGLPTLHITMVPEQAEVIEGVVDEAEDRHLMIYGILNELSTTPKFWYEFGMLKDEYRNHILESIWEQMIEDMKDQGYIH